MNSNSGGSEARKGTKFSNNSNGGSKLRLVGNKYNEVNGEITDSIKQTTAAITDDSNINKPCEGVPSMDWQEKYIDSLDKSVQDIKDEVKDTRTEIKEMRTELKNEFDNKFNQFINELRDRDNQRHLEIITMNQRMDENLKELKADIKATKSEIQATNKWIIGLVIAAVLSFLGIAVSLNIGMINVINIINTLVTKKII